MQLQGCLLPVCSAMFAQHTDAHTQTTLRATCVGKGRIYALRTGDAA